MSIHANALPRACSTGGDASLRLWDLWSGRHAHVHYEGVEAHSSASGSLALSADGRTVYGCGGGSIRCWDVFRGRAPKVRCAITRRARAREGWRAALACAHLHTRPRACFIVPDASRARTPYHACVRVSRAKARLCAHIDGASVLAAHPSMPGLYSGGSDGEICAFEPELEPMHQGGADGACAQPSHGVLSVCPLQCTLVLSARVCADLVALRCLRALPAQSQAQTGASMPHSAAARSSAINGRTKTCTS